MTLTEFLLARIAEDEHRARMAGNIRIWHDEMRRVWIEHPEGARTDLTSVIGDGRHADWIDHLAIHLPGRVLAECEAKRRIVTTMRTALDQAWQDGDAAPVIEFVATRALRALALPYADHTDFQEVDAQDDGGRCRACTTPGFVLVDGLCDSCNGAVAYHDRV